MRYKIYWNWFKIFRKNWYTGNRIKYQPDLTKYCEYLYDLGPLTIVKEKESKTRDNMYEFLDYSISDDMCNGIIIGFSIAVSVVLIIMIALKLLD